MKPVLQTKVVPYGTVGRIKFFSPHLRASIRGLKPRGDSLSRKRINLWCATHGS